MTDRYEEAIEALRAEVRRLRADLMESDEIREALGQLLTLTAKALKGEPPDGVRHLWHDLPERATKLAEALRKLEEHAQRDAALLRQALDALAYWLEHGETPGSHDIIQRTHDVLQERLK